MSIRIGTGYDVHRLAAGRNLILGGIKIAHDKGCLGHSDADVLIHAIIDAMLGALSLGDIGRHFPNNDPEYQGIDSKILLRKTYELITREGYETGNIDSTLCLQRPKIKEHIPAMKRAIAKVLDIDESKVSVKATTTEGLGFAGREEGVSARAVVLLQKKSD